MKKHLIIFISLISTALLSCKETGPIIILEAPIEPLTDTSFVSSTPIATTQRNVLIEEFSGVRCTGCPAGNAEVHGLVTQYPNRIIPITVHIPSDPQTNPYSGSPDLRAQDGELYSPLTGIIGIKPSCLLNREEINGSIQIPSVNSWGSLIQPMLAQDANVSIDLEIVSSDILERKIRYKVTLSYPTPVGAQGLGIALSESEIIAEQLDGATHIEDYEHEYVLRKFLTPLIGDQLATIADANTVIIKEYEIDLDNEDLDANNQWEMGNMELTVFIRDTDGTIANATMVHLTE